MRIIARAILMVIFSAGVFAQAKAELITEFGALPYSHYMSQVDHLRMMQEKTPGSKIYVIYYEGRHYSRQVQDKTSKKYNEVRSGPIRGEALNYARGIGVLLKHTHKFDLRNIVLVDGGYDARVRLELWIVPAGAAPPKPRPTGVEEKDIKFKKGKISGPFDCTHAYDYE